MKRTKKTYETCIMQMKIRKRKTAVIDNGSYIIEQQMKGEQTMTNDFYKGMEHIVKSARDYAEVVKKHYEKDIDRVGPIESSYNTGGAAAMGKMIEYLNIFDSFLKEYDDNDNERIEKN